MSYSLKSYRVTVSYDAPPNVHMDRSIVALAINGKGQVDFEGSGLGFGQDTRRRLSFLVPAPAWAQGIKKRLGVLGVLEGSLRVECEEANGEEE